MKLRESMFSKTGEAPGKGERENFRLIRCFTVEHNVRRLRTYCEALARLPRMVRVERRMHLRRRFSTRGKASAERKAM